MSASATLDTPVARLFRRMIHLQRELAERAAHRRTVLSRFRTDIAPLETRLVEGLRVETALLVDRYARRSLDQARQALLGLWIEENLACLDRHAWQDSAPLEAIRQRWHATLAAGAAATDRHLGSLRARSESERDAAPSVGWRDRADRSDGNHRHAPGDRTARAQPGGMPGSAPNGTRPADDGAATPDAEHRQAVRWTDLATVLFRRLARHLHPDREPDGPRRLAKGRLMQQCIEARRRDDLALLLEMYDRHVAALDTLPPDDIAGDLTPALHREIAHLEKRLARPTGVGRLERMILDHYGDRDTAATLARMDRHRRRLQHELEQLDARIEEIPLDAAFDRLLDDRRRIEFDRMTIGEMTGLQSP